MPEPTHEDAVILVQLAQLGLQANGPQARNWVWSDAFVPEYEEFKRRYPAGSDGFALLTAAATYYETIATLWKHRLINEELVFDWLSIRAVWERVRGVLVGQREEFGEPRLWENFEAMARAQAPAPVGHVAG
jgi:hypothetical protein